MNNGCVCCCKVPVLLHWTGPVSYFPPTPKIILVNGTVWYSQAYSCPSGFSLLPKSKTQRFCGLFLNSWKTEGMKKVLQAV